MIGKNISFKDYCDVVNTGEVVEIFSEKFDDVKFEDKKIVYWSKKGKKYRSGFFFGEHEHQMIYNDIIRYYNENLF